MPPSPENNDQSSIQQDADQHAEEILARRRESRARRAAALTAHPQPLSIKTELIQVPVDAATPPLPLLFLLPRKRQAICWPLATPGSTIPSMTSSLGSTITTGTTSSLRLTGVTPLKPWSRRSGSSINLRVAWTRSSPSAPHPRPSWSQIGRAHV